jgi:beta-galactosidase
MRNETSINRGWRYRADFREEYTDPSMPIDAWEEVQLPHANRELPYNGFDEKDYQFVSCYARDIELPPLEDGKRAFLDFHGVMSEALVWIDGREAGSHAGGYTPFSVEITSLAAGGATSRLVVRVDSSERRDIPPFGHVVDYLCYGGIYREVFLRMQEAAYLRDCFARPLGALEAQKRLELDATIDFGAGTGRSRGGQGAIEGYSVFCTLSEGAKVIGEASGPARLEGGSGAASLALSGLVGLRNWDVDDPALYDLAVSLSKDGLPLDTMRLRVGFRSAEFRSEGFFLNGRRLPLVGLNRHQSFPYVGYAMPARAQARDAEILKRELGVSIVRTSHYPQSPHFLDACDELGLLVFEELPGWQHIGDSAWKDNACLALEEMVRRDRNRPSVVLWGVRINESQDDREFYARTNGIARRLDPTRQTGGVRFLERSELLEDVYTFNDFTHAGGASILKKPRDVTGLRRDVPYLVTEHNGHMFPTKRFDCEERLMEQALRHLRVIEASRAIPGIAGAIGWCAWDYNTHKDFGSGDRVCYHGVMDMFRIPKYAAFAYASQKGPAEGIVLEAASIFAKGERASARLLPIVIFTNCDEVVLYRNGARIGSYAPARAEYPSVAHPPVILRDLVGDQLEGTAFSPRDRVFIKRLIAKVLENGFESLSWLELARFGMLLVKYKMNMADAETLVGKYTLGWGAEEDNFELAGILSGKEVARRIYGGDARAARLSMAADDLELDAGDWDATRVVLRLEDQYGNLYPFCPEVVELSVSGPGRIIGPDRVALIGGCIAFWVRTEGEKGSIEIRARGTRFEAARVTIQVG